MPDEPCLQLESVNVVVTAELHNPSILNPDFLIARGIVPQDWNVSETLTTPPFSVVKYDNGVEWAIDQSTLNVSEKVGPAFDGPFRVHSLAAEYLTQLPHVSYRNLGLNCQVLMKEFDPRAWLLSRFAPSWLQVEHIVRGLRPRLVLDANDAIFHCNLIERTIEPDHYVLADCNVHHQDLRDVERLCAAISRWPERLAWIIEVLDRLMIRKTTQ